MSSNAVVVRAFAWSETGVHGVYLAFSQDLTPSASTIDHLRLNLERCKKHRAQQAKQDERAGEDAGQRPALG